MNLIDIQTELAVFEQKTGLTPNLLILNVDTLIEIAKPLMTHEINFKKIQKGLILGVPFVIAPKIKTFKVAYAI